MQEYYRKIFLIFILEINFLKNYFVKKTFKEIRTKLLQIFWSGLGIINYAPLFLY